jgi:hypothetical protein
VKFYRLSWLYVLSQLLLIASWLLSLWAWEQTDRPWPLTAAFACFAAALAIPWAIHGLLLWKHPDYQRPPGPEGDPVSPSGAWVAAEAPLPVGSRVLAVENDLWYRSVVVGVLSRGRVLVRFTGWSEVWDAPRRVTELQFDLCDQPEGPDHAAVPVPPPVPAQRRLTHGVRTANVRRRRYAFLVVSAGATVFVVGGIFYTAWGVPFWCRSPDGGSCSLGCSTSLYG